MQFSLLSAAWLLHTFQGALGLATQPLSLLRRQDLTQAATELQPQLSSGAVVTFPDDARWEELQIRGSSPRISPAYSVVVEVASESDVVKTVSIANKYNVPFLAVSGTHGWTETLNKLPYGIQIRMRKLNTATVSTNGKTATIGGGMLQWEITRALFAKGKYAVTGLAECVSGIGPLLGGGHSLLQNQYGYALDNLVSANVVLANGTLVTASSTKNADLFWALRGAGHNFGVVSSFVVNVYNVPSTWTVYSLIFTQDKLEALFTLINKYETSAVSRPKKLALTGVLARIPAIDAESPVIPYNVIYEGDNATAYSFAKDFLALGPAATTISTDVNYIQLYTVTGNNLDSQACVRNENILGSGFSLPQWTMDGVRQGFNVFKAATADPRFNSSIVLLENYGMQAIKAVDPASTSLAPEERSRPILASPAIWYSGNDAQAKQEATQYAARIRDAFYIGSSAKRHAYVNYAIGSESLEEVYGYESWRLNKLKSLKKAWDPKNKFGWYNPIA